MILNNAIKSTFPKRTMEEIEDFLNPFREQSPPNVLENRNVPETPNVPEVIHVKSSEEQEYSLSQEILVEDRITGKTGKKPDKEAEKDDEMTRPRMSRYLPWEDDDDYEVEEETETASPVSGSGIKRKAVNSDEKASKHLKKSRYVNRVSAEVSDIEISETDTESEVADIRDKEAVKKKAKALGKKGGDIPLVPYGDKTKKTNKTPKAVNIFDGSDTGKEQSDPYEIATTEGGFSVMRGTRRPYDKAESGSKFSLIFSFFFFFLLSHCSI